MIREGLPIKLQSTNGLTLIGTVAEYDPDESLTVVTNTGDEFEFHQMEGGDFEDARGDEWFVVRQNPCLPCMAALNPNEKKKIGRLPPREGNPMDTIADWHNERYELALYIDNDRDLYRQKQAIEKSLETKVKRGKYDPKLAPKAWMFLVDEGAKKYCKEFRCDVRNTFPKKFVKDPLAVEYAREWEKEYELQEGVKVNPRGKKNPMRKYASESAARDYAKSMGLAYGWSVFSAGWFVGTPEELKKIGVIDIKKNRKGNPGLGHGGRLGKLDHKAISAFLSQKAFVGHKLESTGKRLNGMWMGGTGIAEWKGGKIHLNDLGSRSAQMVQRALLKEAPKNWLASNPRGKAKKVGRLKVKNPKVSLRSVMSKALK